MKRRLSFLFAAVALAAVAATTEFKPAFVSDFKVRDPFVAVDWPHLTSCLYESDGSRVTVRTSADLKAWSAPKAVLELPQGDVRSPKVFARNGAHFLFATVDGGVRSFRAQKPEGPFAPLSAGALTPAGWKAKDGVLFVDDGKPFLVFCREGEKKGPGSMCFVPLADDLASAVGEAKTMFTTEVLRQFKGCCGANDISSPFLRRVVGGDLYLTWTATLACGSTVLQCRSQSRHPEGPWVSQRPLLRRESGDCMLFNAPGGQLYLAVRRPVAAADAKMELYPLLESTAGFELQSAEPPVKMGAEYRVADFPSRGVVAGSALDLSALVGDVPAGTYGFVRSAADGSFEFEKRPGVRVRFNGFNGGSPWRIRGGRDFRQGLDEYLRRVKAQGYNCLRLSLPSMDVIDEKTGAFSFDPELLDDWDWSIAAMKRHGIYVIYHVGTGRFGRKDYRYAWENRDDLKCRMYLGDEEVRRHWRNLADLALNHVNPYTGKAMKDDGMFIAIECYNEQALGLDRAPRPVPGDRYDYTLALVKWYNRTLRELGWRGLITQFNYSKRLVESKVRYLEEDMAISNCYFCHPVGGWGTVGTKMLQHSSYDDALGYWRCNPGLRLPGRPFFVTEHNHCFWNPHQYEEVAFSAYSSFQNFGGVCIHEGSARVDDYAQAASPFAVGNNPVNRADEFLHAMLFLRGDVKASPHTVALTMTERFFAQNRNGAPNARQTMLSLLSGFGVDYPDVETRYPRPKVDFALPAAGASGVFIEAWFTNVLDGPQGSFDPDRTVAALRKGGILSADNRTDPKRGIWESDTKELLLDQSNRTFTVRTPRTEVFASVAGGAADLPHLAVKALPVDASVSLTSLDGRDLGAAERMMLVVNTRALNLGTEFLDGGRRMAKSGTDQVALRTARFDLAFRGRVPQAVFPLSVDGRRRAPLATEPTADGWRLALDTAALPEGPTPFFEIVASEPALRPGDRVALVGDSITEIAVRMKQGFYHRLTNACAKAGRDLGFIPLGRSGFQVGTWLGLEREKKTFEHADAVVVFLGMNDILLPTVSEDDASLDKWAADLRTLATELKAKFGARTVVLGTVTPLTADPLSPKNAVRERMNARVRRLAAAEGWRVAEYGRVIADLQDATRRIDADYRVVPDFVHPNALGHAALAAELCRALGENALAGSFEAEVRDRVAQLRKAAKSPFTIRALPVKRHSPADAGTLGYDVEWTWNGEGEAEVEFGHSSMGKWGVSPRKAVGRTGVQRIGIAAQKLEEEIPFTLTAGGSRRKLTVRLPMPWRVWREEPGATNAALVTGTTDYTGGVSPTSIDPYQYEFGGRANVLRAARWVSSAKRRTVRLRMSHQTFSATLDVKAYLNGRLVLDDRMDRRGRNEVFTNAVLEAGVNRLELRVANRDWQRQFACEILPDDPKDNLGDLTYSWMPPAIPPPTGRFRGPLDATWQKVDAVPASARGVDGTETTAEATYCPDGEGYMGLGKRIRVLRWMNGSAVHFGVRENNAWKTLPYCVTDWDGDGHTDLLAAMDGQVLFLRLSDIRGRKGEERYFFSKQGPVTAQPLPKGNVRALAADAAALYVTVDDGVYRLEKIVP